MYSVVYGFYKCVVYVLRELEKIVSFNGNNNDDDYNYELSFFYVLGIVIY